MNVFLSYIGLMVATVMAGSIQAASSVPTEHFPLQAEDAWIRPAPAVAPVRAGYVQLRNVSDDDIVVDRVISDAFGAIEIHEMHEVEGVMRMRRVPSLVFEAGSLIELKPGGLHLMMFRPSASLEEGATVSIHFHHGDTEVGQAEFRIGEPTQ